MKKFRFVLLALAVSAITFAFTASPEKASFADVHAFTSTGIYIDSAPDVMTLKNDNCPGSDQVFCAQVWTQKTAQNKPAGTRLPDILKP
ncbi:hypothetical protein [Agriterribacter sp.]|uniref:hypothetical protein n=1 Tax=Agriterribacter sp. TaxID=2821509 RepID=UPI002CF229AC|nr:hypothetical protein [Agriterribacter sp.]HRO46341.1 DUF6520 family protein [Agriterribacter sp.]HRQ17508.1 DUF6520 family protein [Agriterribacter sp.]